jgi:aspartate ammonia-lyase
MTATRIESDLLGQREVPVDALWGIHTLRAVENFPPTGSALNPAFITAFAEVKKACALTNAELGHLDSLKAYAIASACDEVASGSWREQFVVDALQGGAGTSTNMNVNEVVASRASALLGSAVHPIADVNLHQSTNDAFPTALRIAAIRRFRALADAVARLQGALQRKEKEFARVVKMGRTELQDAVPMTLGMEFSAFAEAVGRDRWRLYKCEERLRVVNLGGTAIGTGIAAPTDYILNVVDRLREVTGITVARAENLVAETAAGDAYVEVSGMLKAHATTLLKIASDARLLALLGEITLPAVQAGSSIMPGKVNPVLFEMASQVAIKVLANDLIVTECVSRSHLQINEFMPLVAHALLESLDLLIAIDERLATHVAGIQADVSRCRASLERSVTLVTALVPEIGYAAATRLVQEYTATGSTRPFLHFLVTRLGDDVVGRFLQPEHVTRLGHRAQDVAQRDELFAAAREAAEEGEVASVLEKALA